MSGSVNAYVKLIDTERAKMDAESIQLKYGDLNDRDVSDAAARTLDLVDVLRSRPIVQPIVESAADASEPDEETAQGHDDDKTAVIETKQSKEPKIIKERRPFFGNFVENAKSVNRGFLAVALVLILASFGLYIWANYLAGENVASPAVKIDRDRKRRPS